MQSRPVFLGVDGGGSGCRAVVCDPSARLLGSGEAGPANIATDSHGALYNIVESAAAALHDAGIGAERLPDIPVCMGLAGFNTTGPVDTFEDSAPFKQMMLTTDARAALEGALADEDGCVAIIGTGSVYAYRDGARIGTIGGWGFSVSDLSSGARLGQAALQEALLCHDGIRRHTGLTRHLLAQFNDNPRAIAAFAQQASPGAFARLAPVIFDHAGKGDPFASRLVDSAVAEIEAVLDSVLARGKVPLCFVGGLGQLYQHRLDQRFRTLTRKPKGDAATGAARLAIGRFGASTPVHSTAAQ